MLSNITDNRRLVWAIGVKLAPIPVVAILLLVGMLATATGTSPVIRDPATANRQAPHAPVNNAANTNTRSSSNNFLDSLRFWERNRNQPQPRQPNTAASTTGETRSAPRAPVQPPGSAASQRSQTPGLAPEPPPIPYVEPRGGVINVPPSDLAANFGHDANGQDALHPMERRQGTVSHFSYSNDIRDWVEFFPHQQEVRQPTVLQQDVPESAFGVIQTTSFHTTAPRVSETPPPSPQTGNDESSYWDGQATKLANIASIREDISRFQFQQEHPAGMSVAPGVAPGMVLGAVSGAAPGMATPVERVPIVPIVPIDLTPSYTSRLPHTQTCGVVVVQANFPLTEIASILDEINLLQRDLTQYIGIPAPQEKIELCLFKDQRSYLEFLGEFFPRAPRNRRALYVKLDGKPGTLMVQQSKDFEVDLRHEMTHAIVHASIPRVPIWLDEGLAKYFEVPPQDRYNHHPYLREIRRNAGLGMVPSLDRLAKMENIDDMDSKEYRESWAWTHFMIHRSPETQQLLAAYLQMLAEHPGEVGTGPHLSVATVFTSGRRQSIPSLKLYLDDMMPNQREAFREHFGTLER